MTQTFVTVILIDGEEVRSRGTLETARANWELLRPLEKWGVIRIEEDTGQPCDIDLAAWGEEQSDWSDQQLAEWRLSG